MEDFTSFTPVFYCPLCCAHFTPPPCARLPPCLPALPWLVLLTLVNPPFYLYVRMCLSTFAIIYLCMWTMFTHLEQMSGFASHPPLTEFVFFQWIVTLTCAVYGVRMLGFATCSVHTEEWLYSTEATLCPCWNISVLHCRNALAPSLVLALFHVKFACSHLDCVGFLLGKLNIFPLPTNMPAWSLFLPLHTGVSMGESCVFHAM